MGCYNDKVVRDLPFLAKIGLVTLNNCRQACWRYGFKYFGVQNSNLCYCGDTYNKYGKVDDVRCQKRCLGNKAQICGDLWLNNIYETGIGGNDESDYTRETESEKSEEQTVPDEESTIIDGNTDNEPSIDKDTDSGADT
uniref:WSC domain-containing protein n=1 Tax=Macrostomum lignano TaxID=282301 RepID=A0A1I8J137_9PLAT